MTAIEWLYDELSKNNNSTDSVIDRINKQLQIWKQAKEMEKVRILLFAEEYDEYVFRGGSATAEQYYEETFKTK